jgi:hypothetical protein
LRVVCYCARRQGQRRCRIERIFRVRTVQRALLFCRNGVA